MDRLGCKKIKPQENFTCDLLFKGHIYSKLQLFSMSGSYNKLYRSSVIKKKPRRSGANE